MLCHDVFVKICYRCVNICCVRFINICYIMLCMLCYVMLCYVMLTASYNNMCYVMICCIAAGCYVNCVLGYEHICYFNMLHVLSCTFLHEKHISTKTNNTGYPALDPTANKYLSGLGWECISVVLFLLFFLEAFYVCLLLLYVLFRL